MSITNGFTDVQITIIIFSKDRNNMLLRQIEYWKDEQVKVLIFHETSLKLDIDFKKYPNINYDSSGSLQERFLRSIELISTPFAIISADDDFLIKKTLFSCLDYLKKNTEITTCGGQIFSFIPNKNEIAFRFSYPENLYFANTSDIVHERIRYQSSPYKMTNWYSLTKSDHMKKLLYVIGHMPDISSDEINASPELTEVTLELTSSILGKTHCISDILYLRSEELQSLWVSSWGGLRCWAVTKYHQKGREVFVEKVSNLIAHVTTLNKSEIQALLYEGLQNYAYKQNTSLYNKVKFILIKYMWDLFLKIHLLYKLNSLRKILLSRLLKKGNLNFQSDIIINQHQEIKFISSQINKMIYSANFQSTLMNFAYTYFYKKNDSSSNLFIEKS